MNVRKYDYLIWLGLLVLLLAGVFSCSGGGGGSGTSTSSGGDGTGGGNTGTLTINLTDSPFSDARAVLVTFSEVQVHRSGSGWVTVPFAGGNSSRTCDLKKLVGAQNVLGTGPLPAGHYTMIRLVVTQSALYFDNPANGPACAPSITSPQGQSAPLEISSGEIKLNREFDLVTGRPTTILLDFDGDHSIHQTGNDRYKMNPVISVVSVQ
jgi:Domain of unknown function (DUF4382)